jgi:hypothetical protein
MNLLTRAHGAPLRHRAAHAALAALATLATFAAAPALAVEDDKIVTDRPDFVESSAVVGKGRVQLETSFAVERSRIDGGIERATSTPTLLRLGVGDTIELRFETDGRLHAWSGGAGSGSDERGYSDTAVGLKWHALDAHGNAPAVGVLVHADLATGSKAFRGQGVRPSLRLVGEWELPADFALGVMPGIASQTGADGKRFTAGIFGIVLGKEWSERFRSFVEISAPQVARGRDGGSQVSFDAGVAYLVSDHIQLDSALSRGLNRNTPDLSWTVGLSFKL